MLIINKLIFLPIICSLYRYTHININNNNTLSNPYIGRCNNNKCRRIYYSREKTFFSLFPKTNISTILYIIKILLLEKKNGNDIYNHIKNETENIIISKQKIEEILSKLRNFIAHYLKDMYILENISKTNEYKYYAIDESEFVKRN